MIAVENAKVYNLARAIYSARNAMQSWAYSDSDIDRGIVGKKDLELANKLYLAGPEHRKFLRQVAVVMDITAPLYWWKQFDTYKVGVSVSSTSTMHSLMKRPLELKDFSTDGMPNALISTVEVAMSNINDCISHYKVSNRKDFERAAFMLLPSCYNQKRTVTMNYENVVRIIRQRSTHKLDEWQEFAGFLRTLSCVKGIMEHDESDKTDEKDDVDKKEKLDELDKEIAKREIILACMKKEKSARVKVLKAEIKTLQKTLDCIKLAKTVATAEGK